MSLSACHNLLLLLMATLLIIFLFDIFPYCRLFKNKPPQTEEDDAAQAGENKASKGGIMYGEYLKVKSFLSTFRIGYFWVLDNIL